MRVDAIPMTLRAALLSVVLFVCFLFAWQLLSASGQTEAPVGMDPELAALLGPQAKGESAFPAPAEVFGELKRHVTDPFYDAGPNDKGIGIQLAYSIMRVLVGFGLAALVAIPLGFVIGMSPLLFKALDPIIQLLKPISPLAWMPLALYTIQDSMTSAIFVIFICSLWPMLINTAFGVGAVRTEYVNVAKTLELGPWRTALSVILPAAAPTILTGMRISIGIAWLVIVAAEMLVGGTGIGYFVWNEWNILSITNVIAAILFIGVIGMVLDPIVAFFQQRVSYAD